MKFGDVIKIVKNNGKTTRDEDMYVGMEAVFISGNVVIEKNQLGTPCPTILYLAEPLELELVEEFDKSYFEDPVDRALPPVSQELTSFEGMEGVMISAESIEYLEKLKGIFTS